MALRTHSAAQTSEVSQMMRRAWKATVDGINLRILLDEHGQLIMLQADFDEWTKVELIPMEPTYG